MLLFYINLSEVYGIIQTPMQSCRSLQSLSISANVSEVVQKRLIM